MEHRRPEPVSFIHVSAALICIAFLGGCKSAFFGAAVPVEPLQLTMASTACYAQQYRSKSATDVTGKRSFSVQDCRDITLARNLDLQVKRWEELANEDLKESARAGMLPHLVVAGEVGRRNNLPYQYADVIGQEGLKPAPGSTSTAVTNYHTYDQRNTWRQTLEAWWSPTDAALNYILYNNTCNKQWNSHFQRVRSAQKLVGSVEAAYYRLVGLQEGLQMADKLLSIRSGTAKKAVALLKKGLISQEECYRAKLNEDKARRLLSKLRNNMEKQRNIIAGAMGISPDHCDGGFFATDKLEEPAFRGEICDLELLAMKNRPEAYIAGLNHFTSVNELKKAVVNYLPRVVGSWKYTRDDNTYLLNKDWNEISLLATFDATEWLANMKKARSAKSDAARSLSQVGAVAVGIASEVRVAALEYMDALEDMRNGDKSLKDSKEMLKVMRGRASKNEADRISVDEAEGDILHERITQIMALAGANARLAQLRSVLGVNYSEPLACN
jgi:outer membrane protein, multidrug efflux system